MSDVTPHSKITDVAREAGVSTATVSRVLNGATVRKANRAKVEAAIKRIGYIPNYLAKGSSRSSNPSRWASL